MSKPTWLDRITRCDSIYFLRADDDLEEGDDDIYLVLMAKNGREYRLRLSPEACESLYDQLTLALQSSYSPLLKKSPGPNKGN